MNIYDFTMKDIHGKEVSLSEYKGKVILIVNTATGCGHTHQYEGLEELYKKYKDLGFVILDFPCNQFAGQAPGTNKEIADFCKMQYKVTFPQFAKINVNGKEEAPLYTYLKSKKGGVINSRIKWNFTKFLIDREGTVVARFGPPILPEKIAPKILELL